jgi:hypothetical protein
LGNNRLSAPQIGGPGAIVSGDVPGGSGICHDVPRISNSRYFSQSIASVEWGAVVTGILFLEDQWSWFSACQYHESLQLSKDPVYV